MSAYDFDVLAQKWENDGIDIEQLAGQLLVHAAQQAEDIKKLRDRVRQLESQQKPTMAVSATPLDQHVAQTA